ncbi:MAG: 5,10-methylenetetrahydromethanopterin reductase [Candidatus Methanomethylicia archaeon]|nr:5,10-methylenetetrahydromethanopterin reductase [Candidatus Methanomethylicia archaeon]MCX8168898.1 5,10-methylenetetrahydromethanopterin reductase [Candidatus Methanomethylicia archaeon]MDW7988630.1 5,10-methylenetetrahydromethanopterin reductase [Nitrososphaerota archaeon]
MSNVKFGLELLPVTPILDVVDVSKHAENLGFDVIWVTDHYNNRNVYVTLTSIALNTKNIKIGTGVVNPYVVNPLWTASAIASVDEISGGRAILGIGAGDRATLEKMAIDWGKPLVVIRESVEIIRRLLKGEVVTFEGEFVKSRGAALTYKPVHEIPIYIGAQGPKMLTLASSIGDGILINASHPKDYDYAIKIIKKAAGDRFNKLDIVACTSFSIDKDKTTAIKNVRPVVAFIVAGAGEDVLKRHEIDVEKVNIIRDNLSKGKFKDAASAVTDDMINAFSITGTPSECIEMIDKLIKKGVTQLVLGSPIGKDKKAALEITASEVLVHFKQNK